MCLRVITIKHGTRILLKTNYQYVSVDELNWNRSSFSHLLEDIYSLSHNSYSLSQEQFDRISNLYVEFILEWLSVLDSGCKSLVFCEEEI